VSDVIPFVYEHNEPCRVSFGVNRTVKAVNAANYMQFP
jgi:hypothetical protein